MHPELSWLGHGPVASYGLMLALGALVFVAVLATSAARTDLPRLHVLAWIWGTYLATVLGARAGFAAARLPAWDAARDALASPALGGFSSVGGLVGATLAGAILGRWLGLPLRRLAGPAVLAGCCFGALTRMGCFLAGCCHGRPAAWPLGVVYPPDAPASLLYGAGVPVHPVPLYEALLLLALALALAWAGPRRAGAWAAPAVAAYLCGRFGLDLLRGDVARQLGLSFTQWLILGLAAAVAVTRALTTFARRGNTLAIEGVSWRTGGG